MSERDKAQATTKWYDGFSYDKLVTPLQKKIMGQVEELVTNNSTVLDVGCGPGALALRLSAKCQSVLGLDRSEKMIAYARRQLAKKGVTNVNFVCDDAAELGMIQKEQFTVAVLCVCLHGMSLDTRHKVIVNCCRLAGKVVLIDYVEPFPANVTGRVQNIIEALEGRDSYSLREYAFPRLSLGITWRWSCLRRGFLDRVMRSGLDRCDPVYRRGN